MKNIKRICITGASGFVATNLQYYLKTSIEVLSISVRYNSNQTFEIIGNALIHLAGKAHDLKKVSNPQEYYEANYELTKQLFDAYLLSKVSLENKNYYA
jgi:nucleoside-diphosphate-sugar epimerase